MSDRRKAPLRAVVYREEPTAASINQSQVIEEYECGHGNNWAPMKPATRRRCSGCLKEAK
jgi:hypothetical protein